MSSETREGKASADSRPLEEKVETLAAIIRANVPLLVAYSGGADSACLLAFASRLPGAEVTGVIADSPSLPRASLAAALELAAEWGVPVEVISTKELDDPRYVENPLNRCYFCKWELFQRMHELAAERGMAAIAYGENADDPAHLRPGSVAARELAVLAPLRLAGLTKADVRALSRKMGLATAEQPAQPCLSSRIPHGVPVTRDILALVERGEAAVRSLGFRVFRVRYVPAIPAGARVEIAPGESERARAFQPAIIEALTFAGFSSVEIDPRGYRSVS